MSNPRLGGNWLISRVSHVTRAVSLIPQGHMCVFLGPQIQFLGGKPKADYLVGVYLLGVYNILTTLLGCIYLINTLLGCIYLINTLLGCIHLIPCWCVLPSTEAQMPFPHHVSAVARLLQKHWQHWKSCLKYFGKLFSIDIGFFLPVGTPPARRGFNARCCRPRWKGYLR